MIIKRSIQCKECGKWIYIYANESVRRIEAKCECGNIENIK